MRFDKRVTFAAVLVTASLAAAACSRTADPAGTESAQIGGPDANLAAADMGGAVEELTGNYGPGFTGRLLIDGKLTPTWKRNATESEEKIPYPQEAVLSFYERHPALIQAVTINVPNPSLAPKDVEVWTSMDAADDRYGKVAAVALAANTGEQTISFTPVEARFVKLRIVSGADAGLEIAELKVIEGARSGYTPLFARQPYVKFWKGSPREAAQRGLDWLQQAGPTWAQHYKCFGCHVQAQALMGQAVALKHGYRVNMKSVKALNEDTRTHLKAGDMEGPDRVTENMFAAIGVAYAADVLNLKNDKGLFGDSTKDKGALQKTADFLIAAMRKEGAVPIDHIQPPIVQGELMTTANTLVSLRRAATNSNTASYSQAAARALAWIAVQEPETTQDKVFKLIALMHYGTPEHKRSAWAIVEKLTAEQMPDGGWKESSDQPGSNVFATGQVLYAFKQAGLSIHGEVFKRGVDFLLKLQINKPGIAEGQPPIVYADGSWPVINSNSNNTGFQSTYAPTMWAVIGLAGSFSAEPTGALQIVKRRGNKPPARNLEIVLDVSGSMNTKLGNTTRWATAMDVFKRVVAQLPADHNVGLRVYGHRHSSKSEETCTDTELLVPVEPLDRQRMIAAVSGLRPRGETPLIRSTLETIGDLKTVGGGSVILITDGEESCGGDVKAAAAQIKASGLNVTLDIVGFTITGQATQAALGALAGSTGGRYYAAQDGAQLSRAVLLAALQRLPYDILDSSGKVIVSGETSELSRELPPGTYRLRINAHGQVLEEPITITANQTTALTLDVDGDRFVIKR